MFFSSPAPSFVIGGCSLSGDDLRDRSVYDVANCQDNSNFSTKRPSSLTSRSHWRDYIARSSDPAHGWAKWQLGIVIASIPIILAVAVGSFYIYRRNLKKKYRTRRGTIHRIRSRDRSASWLIDVDDVESLGYENIDPPSPRQRTTKRAKCRESALWRITKWNPFITQPMPVVTPAYFTLSVDAPPHASHVPIPPSATLPVNRPAWTIERQSADKKAHFPSRYEEEHASLLDSDHAQISHHLFKTQSPSVHAPFTTISNAEDQRLQWTLTPPGPAQSFTSSSSPVRTCHNHDALSQSPYLIPREPVTSDVPDSGQMNTQSAEDISTKPSDSISEAYKIYVRPSRSDPSLLFPGAVRAAGYMGTPDGYSYGNPS